MQCTAQNGGWQMCLRSATGYIARLMSIPTPARTRGVLCLSRSRALFGFRSYLWWAVMNVRLRGAFIIENWKLLAIYSWLFIREWITYVKSNQQQRSYIYISNDRIAHASLLIIHLVLMTVICIYCNKQIIIQQLSLPVITSAGV